MSHSRILFLDSDIRRLWFNQSKHAVADALLLSELWIH